MKERYMIVKIFNILGEVNDTMVTESCYQIVDGDYETPDSAYRVKENYIHPNHYIVVQYWN